MPSGYIITPAEGRSWNLQPALLAEYLRRDWHCQVNDSLPEELRRSAVLEFSFTMADPRWRDWYARLNHSLPAELRRYTTPEFRLAMENPRWDGCLLTGDALSLECPIDIAAEFAVRLKARFTDLPDLLVYDPELCIGAEVTCDTAREDIARVWTDASYIPETARYVDARLPFYFGQNDMIAWLTRDWSNVQIERDELHFSCSFIADSELCNVQFIHPNSLQVMSSLEGFARFATWQRDRVGVSARLVARSWTPLSLDLDVTLTPEDLIRALRAAEAEVRRRQDLRLGEQP